MEELNNNMVKETGVGWMGDTQYGGKRNTILFPFSQFFSSVFFNKHMFNYVSFLRVNIQVYPNFRKSLIDKMAPRTQIHENCDIRPNLKL